MIEKDDYFILYLDERSYYMLPYFENQSFSSHRGNVKLEGDTSFGDKVTTHLGTDFYVLKPTLADRMMKVKRRTTIIYPKEAGTILLELGIENGSRVIEIGSGSGSLTILLSRIVGEKGKVYSFERRPEHQEMAIKNVKRFGRPENVEFILKDPVTEGGFGLTDIDSIFLDVPEPWTLIDAAYEALSGGGFIGALNPNIEQIQTTVEKMNHSGFIRVRCIENLQRGIRVKKNLTRPHDRMIAHTGYLLFAQKINELPQNISETDLSDEEDLTSETGEMEN
jgi:tRNA (adenine57-N1/adenine58-N1)-methyltransferase